MGVERQPGVLQQGTSEKGGRLTMPDRARKSAISASCSLRICSSSALPAEEQCETEVSRASQRTRREAMPTHCSLAESCTLIVDAVLGCDGVD